MIGAKQYTLEKVVGKGANGVVVEATCASGTKVAIKLCDPWIARIHPADRCIDVLRDWGRQTQQVIMDENKHRLKLEFYDVTPDALVAKLHACDVHLTPHRKGLSENFAMWSIAGCVQSVPIGNGALLMPLLGPSLFGSLPLTPPLYRKLKEVLITACMSALVQGVALVDLKPANICYAGDTFVVVDTDTLALAAPGVDTAEPWATFTVPCLLPSTIATMLVNLVLTLAQAMGTVNAGTVYAKFGHDSRYGAKIDDLAAIAPLTTKPIVDALSPNMSVSMALDTLGQRLPLSPPTR